MHMFARVARGVARGGLCMCFKGATFACKCFTLLYMYIRVKIIIGYLKLS